METTQTFTPERITITRRPDGHFDLVALCDIPGSTDKGEVTMILEQATLNLAARFTPREDYVWDGKVHCTVPSRAVEYHMALVTWLLGGVGGMADTYLRQRVISQPTSFTAVRGS